MLLTDAIERLEEELREAEIDHRSALRSAELHAERADMLRTAIAALRREKVRPVDPPAVEEPGSESTSPTQPETTIRDEMRLPSPDLPPAPSDDGGWTGTVRAAIEDILAKQGTVRADDVRRLTGKAITTVAPELCRMAAAGDIVRVARGVYRGGR